MICHAHYDAATLFERKNYKYGVPVTVLSAAVGTSVFVTIDSSPEMWAKILVGLTSFAVSILSALQTFFKYTERAEKHRIAGARFGSLLKEIERVTLTSGEEKPDFDVWAKDFQERWDTLSEESSTIPRKIFLQHRAKHKHTIHNSEPDSGGNG